MRISLFGATGSLGRELLAQSVDAGHEVTVLVRSPDKLATEYAGRVQIVKGDALAAADVDAAIPAGTDAILFALGVDEKTSPPDLCTDATRLILARMRGVGVGRLVWCGGGSNLRDEDVVTFGARFVRWFSERFLAHRHTDKEHQLALLDASTDVCWSGVRPLQMNPGALTGQYRLGYHRFSGLSKISFADCAHAMMTMLQDDTWVGKVPVVQY